MQQQQYLDSDSSIWGYKAWGLGDIDGLQCVLIDSSQVVGLHCGRTSAGTIVLARELLAQAANPSPPLLLLLLVPPAAAGR